MPDETVLRALRHAWLLLESLNVPAAVVGGIAMASWKCIRATEVADLLIAIGDDDVERLLRRLGEAEIHPKRDPPVKSLGELDVIQLLYEPPETFVEVQIDVLVAKSEYYQTSLQRRVATRLPDLDLEIAVLACEDLILHKLLAGRIIDRADAAALLRANRESIRTEQLRQWADSLGLSSALTEVWNEAFPVE